MSSIYFGTKVKIPTERLARATLLAWVFSFGGSTPSLNNQTVNSESKVELVKFAVMSTSDGLIATKYPGIPDLILRIKSLQN